jgi:hypothetical protein
MKRDTGHHGRQPGDRERTRQTAQEVQPGRKALE